VAQVAAERHAFEKALEAVMEEPGLAESDDAIIDSWDALHPASADEGPTCQSSGGEQGSTSVLEAFKKLPYDLSPARRRCLELVVELSEQPMTDAAEPS
jgi:hypothetical protein